MPDVIEQLSAADPEFGQATDPVKPPAGLLASIMDGPDIELPLAEINSVPSPRRPRWRLAAAFTGFAAVLVVGTVTFLAINDTPGPSDDDVALNPDAFITSEMILQDGVVTEEEYHAGAEAVVLCLGEVGIETELHFDNPNGHAGFRGRDTGPLALEQSLDEASPYDTAFDRCTEVHLSLNVNLGWAVTLGQLNLEELRAETNAVVECVASQTGEDFGELTYDGFGYLTEQGQQTSDAAFEYQDHEPWTTCKNELGYLDEVRAETKAILECVEKRTGEDFGELTYDDSGSLTEEGQQTLRAAVTYQSDVPWNACVQELGLY